MKQQLVTVLVVLAAHLPGFQSVQAFPDRPIKLVVASTPGAPPDVIARLLSDRMTAILGQPLSIVDLGTKKIYVYKNLKVTFTAGKVSDVQ